MFLILKSTRDSKIEFPCIIKPSKVFSLGFPKYTIAKNYCCHQKAQKYGNEIIIEEFIEAEKSHVRHINLIQKSLLYH